MKKHLILLFTLFTVSSVSYSKEEQYVCEFNTEVIIGNSLSDKPTPTVKKIDEKYTFFYDGKNGSYINLIHGVKIPLYVIKEGNRVTFIEKNTGDNYFVVSIFTDKRDKRNWYGSIKSFLTYGVTSKFYDPSQSFGSCSIVSS